MRANLILLEVYRDHDAPTVAIGPLLPAQLTPPIPLTKCERQMNLLHHRSVSQFPLLGRDYCTVGTEYHPICQIETLSRLK